MILTTQNLLHYLLDRGVIEASAAVDGDVRIAEASRRHRNFKVLRRHGPGFFVKQIQSFDPHTVACLQREGTCSWLAENDDAFAPLRGRLPAFRDYDPTRHALVIDLFSEAEVLSEHHRRSEEFPVEIGAEIGRLLGELHSEVRVAPDDERLARFFPGLLPPILLLHQTPPASFQTYGPAAAHVIDMVRRDAAFAQAFSWLVRDWQKSSLIHGDVKWDNFLVVPENGRPENGRLRWIDWELADVGDPAWDAGAVFQAYLASWVWSMSEAPASSGNPAAQAAFPLERMQPAMGAFWESYCEKRGIPGEDQDEQLRRCLCYGAGRMIQTAFEMAVASRQVTPQTLLLVQLSWNLLTRTRDAVHELLGM
jgi:thiamine kinase-like enzyme